MHKDVMLSTIEPEDNLEYVNLPINRNNGGTPMRITCIGFQSRDDSEDIEILTPFDQKGVLIVIDEDKIVVISPDTKIFRRIANLVLGIYISKFINDGWILEVKSITRYIAKDNKWVHDDVNDPRVKGIIKSAVWSCYHQEEAEKELEALNYLVQGG